MEYINNMLATIKKELHRRKGQWPDIARNAGVSYSFVAHVANNHTENPRIQECQRVLNELKRRTDADIVASEQAGE